MEFLARPIAKLKKLQDDTTHVEPYAAMIDCANFIKFDLSGLIDDLETAQILIEQTKNAHGCSRGR